MRYHFRRSEEEMTMRRTTLVLLAVSILFVSASLEARPGWGGTYFVNGTNPGVGVYKGTLNIPPRGDVYDVRWSIAGLRYTGVGIVVNDTLSLAYSDANHSFIGVASYTREGGTLYGHWAVAGRGGLGAHTPSPRARR